MAILIKNPETERKARELATLTGDTITSAIDAALEEALEQARPQKRPTIAEMKAATERLWDRAGMRPPFPPVTKAEWDEINEVPGLEDDN